MRFVSLVPRVALLVLPVTLTACDLLGFGDDRKVYDACETPKGGAQTCFSATDVTVGTGAAAMEDDIADVSYVGYIGTTKFQEGRFSFVLDRAKGTREPTDVVPGMYFAVAGATSEDIDDLPATLAPMKVGGKRRVSFPPNLGYGGDEQRDQSGYVIIPANSTLTFDVTLNAIRTPD